MAGIEQLEIHSKSYIVRWVKVDGGNTISWSVQPHKKSINFGIVKHPGTGGTNLASSHPEDTTGTAPESKSGLFAKKDASTAQDQLASKGFIPLKWHGKCEADKVSIGTFDVAPGQGGMFGLVFDNTFSKQTSKTATFVLLTYPTGAPPHMTHLPNLQATARSSQTSLPKGGSPMLGAFPSESVDSLNSHKAKGTSISARSDGGITPATYHVGNLLKRRRKKGQGFANRFFSLDYNSCTLSYYYNRNSSALRGAIPLSLAAIAADERRREISIDSGAEVWHLKASNQKDFGEWARALEKASRIARGLEALPDPSPTPLQLNTDQLKPPPHTSAEEDREWQQVESLVCRVVGTRDALRRLVKDMAAQKYPYSGHSSNNFLSPATATPLGSEDSGSYFPPNPEKRPFWKRKPSGSPLTPQAFQPSISSALAVPYPGSVGITATTITANGPTTKLAKRNSRGPAREEKSMQDHCNALLHDLDNVLSEFTHLISNSKRRRLPLPGSATGSRKSMESATSNEEFFDAEAGESQSQLVKIERQSEEDSPESEEEEIHDSSSISSIEEDETLGQDDAATLYPSKPKSLAPLPIEDSVKRRVTVPPSTIPPPSLISFVRKNVGKDLSTISMPVSSNEPISLLQRAAEQLEYADLLDTAAKQKLPKDRLLYVAAFAVSQFSGGRARERAVRKPFTPLLGETFELLRTERETPGGFRLLVEKVSHRPVRLAMQADAARWSLSQSPAPTQKFWGKSAELTTEGRVRLALRLPDGHDELYSWGVATMFLRNVVMGEKYVEPVGAMAVSNDSTGARATVEFRSKGMFGGRGEDVQVEAYEPDGTHTGSSLSGTWTGSLRVVEAGKAAGEEVWRAGRLVDNAAQTYGLPAFAAGLNEVTAIEKGRLPPTDTRLRPDQRLVEKGQLQEAEEWKAKLEEAQRARRRVAEARGVEHRPRWFTKVATGPDGEEVWKMKGGKESYWEERAKGAWTGVEDIFAA